MELPRAMTAQGFGPGWVSLWGGERDASVPHGMSHARSGPHLRSVEQERARVPAVAPPNQLPMTVMQPVSRYGTPISQVARRQFSEPHLERGACSVAAPAPPPMTTVPVPTMPGPPGRRSGTGVGGGDPASARSAMTQRTWSPVPWSSPAAPAQPMSARARSQSGTKLTPQPPMDARGGPPVVVLPLGQPRR